MIKVGQVFRNYKEMCTALGEEPVSGNSRKKQLRRWGYKYDWHKEGQKIIIDGVRDGVEMPDDFRAGGNHDEHVEVMYPYVKRHIVGAEKDEYLGTQRLLGSTLRLMPMAAYNQINNRGIKKAEFYRKYGLEDIGSFEEYVSVAGLVLRDTVVKCLRKMQRNNEIRFCEAEVFIVKDGRRRYLCVDGYDSFIKECEGKVCDEMAFERGFNTKGRQLIHFIRGHKELMNEFYARSMKEIFKNGELVKELKKQYYIIGPGVELDLGKVTEYYKAVHIIEYDRDELTHEKDYSYKEKEVLKAIYEDIKPRIAARVSSSKLDVAKIEKMIFS